MCRALAFDVGNYHRVRVLIRFPVLSWRFTVALALATGGCRDAGPPAPPAHAVPKTPALFTASLAFADSAVPDGPLGASIRRGLALLEHTPDSLPEYTGGNLRCTSCHLDHGLRPDAAPLTGVHARFPKLMDRSAAVVPLEDRVNYCFTRSLAGRALPPRSREMVDIIAYLAFISRGVPVGAHVAGEGMTKMPALTGDSARGHELFTANCTRCHGVDGAGIAAVPAVWGAKSYSVGASMARVERAASFVRHNMPFDKPGSLTDQQAFDLAAYVNAHARPDSPGKELDWPAGGAPADVPYATRGHAPAIVTPVLPRKRADGGIVPPPMPAAGRSGE
ncbi:MAG: cytochrome c class [Gemmatimonadetes bacterium]|nr:cytochrome c class [Gemmatimonadota bacterium]